MKTRSKKLKLATLRKEADVGGNYHDLRKAFVGLIDILIDEQKTKRVVDAEIKAPNRVKLVKEDYASDQSKKLAIARATLSSLLKQFKAERSPSDGSRGTRVFNDFIEEIETALAATGQKP